MDFAVDAVSLSNLGGPYNVWGLKKSQHAK
jgi:hypothetical protein